MHLVVHDPIRRALPLAGKVETSAWYHAVIHS